MRQFYSLLFSAILAAHLLTPAQGPGGHGDESIYSLEAPVYGVVQKGKALEPLPAQGVRPLRGKRAAEPIYELAHPAYGEVQKRKAPAESQYDVALPAHRPHEPLPMARIRQEDVNAFIVRSKSDGTLTAETLVNQFIIWGIHVLVFDFTGTLIESTFRGWMDRTDQATMNKLVAGVTRDAIAIIKEWTRRRLSFYVASFSDPQYCNKLTGEKRRRCIAGKSLIMDVLGKNGLHAEEIYAYNPGFYKTPEAYRVVNPDAKQGEAMPVFKTFHLQLAENRSKVPRHQVLLIDDNHESCVAAVKRGNYAIWVEKGEGGNGLRFTTMSPVVLP